MDTIQQLKEKHYLYQKIDVMNLEEVNLMLKAELDDKVLEEAVRDHCKRRLRLIKILDRIRENCLGL